MGGTNNDFNGHILITKLIITSIIIMSLYFILSHKSDDPEMIVWVSWAGIEVFILLLKNLESYGFERLH